MLESLINLKTAIRHNKSKSEVREKFLEYSRKYDDLENKNIGDKIRHREIFYNYIRYMEKSGE